MGDVLKEEFLPRYIQAGEQKFYRFLLVYAMNKIIAIEKKKYKGEFPSLEFLDYHERFILLYRKEGNKVYLELSRIFRKAAHKTYRALLKKNMVAVNSRFLNVVR
jgi:hypothetical protein